MNNSGKYMVNKILEYINRLLDMEHISLGDIAVISSNKNYLRKVDFYLRNAECFLGLNRGYNQGYNKGYYEGYRSGYDEIYFEDPSEDYTQDFDNNYSQDYYQIFELGYKSGYKKGRDWGYNWGYSQKCSHNRYEPGYSQGYNQGYGYDPINYEYNRVHYPTTTTFKPWDGVEALSNPNNTDNSVDKPYKLKFFRDNDYIKLSTTHSFKGWEIPYVIVVIPPGLDRETNNDFLTYTGLSRPKKGMLIINLNPKYTDFFESQHLNIL